MSYRVLTIREDDGLALVALLNERGQRHTFPIFGLPEWLRVGGGVRFVAERGLFRLIPADSRSRTP